ncbi:unnamed protein product [Alopecurus aequalis]
MSTEKRVCRCSGTAQEALSLDLLLEVVALADVATVVRCAATGRTLRRAILDPAFRRRLALAADDGFDPALLLGVSYLDSTRAHGSTGHSRPRTAVNGAPSAKSLSPNAPNRASPAAPVIGRTVYLPSQVHAKSHFDHILALNVDSGEATMMELPAACFSRMTTSRRRDAHLLLAAVRRRLCLLVAESRGIAMWTLATSVAAGTWSRQVVISNLEIARQAGLDTCRFTLSPFRAVGLGERSGALILNWSSTCELPLLRLDLGTKEKTAPPVVTKLSWPEVGRGFTRLFLHEIDLLSLLQAMKSL